MLDLQYFDNTMVLVRDSLLADEASVSYLQALSARRGFDIGYIVQLLRSPAVMELRADLTIATVAMGLPAATSYTLWDYESLSRGATQLASNLGSTNLTRMTIQQAASYVDLEVQKPAPANGGYVLMEMRMKPELPTKAMFSFKDRAGPYIYTDAPMQTEVFKELQLAIAPMFDRLNLQKSLRTLVRDTAIAKRVIRAHAVGVPHTLQLALALSLGAEARLVTRVNGADVTTVNILLSIPFVGQRPAYDTRSVYRDGFFWTEDPAEILLHLDQSRDGTTELALIADIMPKTDSLSWNRAGWSLEGEGGATTVVFPPQSTFGSALPNGQVRLSSSELFGVEQEAIYQQLSSAAAFVWLTYQRATLSWLYLLLQPQDGKPLAISTAIGTSMSNALTRWGLLYALQFRTIAGSGAISAQRTRVEYRAARAVNASDPEWTTTRAELERDRVQQRIDLQLVLMALGRTGSLSPQLMDAFATLYINTGAEDQMFMLAQP
jgi:hypothetical protein